MDISNQYAKINFREENFILENFILLISDLFFLILSFGIAIGIRSLLIPLLGGVIIGELNRSLLLMLLASNIILITINGNYPGRGTIAVLELRNIVQAISTAYFLTGGVIFLTIPASNYSRSMFLISWILSCLFVPFGRFAVRKFFSLQSWWGEPVAIIGFPKEIVYLYKDVKKCRRLGFRPVVGLYLPTDEKREETTYLPFYPLNETVLEFIKSRNIKTVIVSIPPKEFRNQNPNLFNLLEKNFIRSIFILDNLSFGFLWGKPIDIEGRPAFQLQHNLLNPVTQAVKYLTDRLLMLILFLPILIIILITAVIVWIDSPGKIFYTQKRIGKNKKTFYIYKFRTMIPGAEDLLSSILEENPHFKKEYEKYHKLEEDPRLTSVGKWLRRLSLDELPQIFNIVRGEMSFIGPRAYMPSELPKIDNGDLIFRIRPGLTGWWQVMGRNETTFEQRLKMDVYYINNWSLWMDLYIFLKSFWVLLSGKGL